MQSKAVKLAVIASVPMECEFLPEADGWSGVCDELSLLVRGDNFQDAKRNMEAALRNYLQTLLADSGKMVA